MPADWPFTDPENLAVFTLKRIVRGGSPILRVTHDADDGGRQFLDSGDVAIEEESFVSLREMTRLDPSVLELANLPLGWVARPEGPGVRGRDRSCPTIDRPWPGRRAPWGEGQTPSLR